MSAGATNSVFASFLTHFFGPMAVVAALVAVPTGLILHSQRQQEQQEQRSQLEQAVQDLGGRTTYEASGPKSEAAHAALVAIDLSETDVDDRDLQDLTAATTIGRIDLRGTNVTDQGMATLENFEHLTFVDVRGTRVSAEGVERLREQFPRIEINVGKLPATPTRAFVRRAQMKQGQVGPVGTGLGSMANPSAVAGAVDAKTQLPEAKTFSAIGLGLEYLVRVQQADGSWSLHRAAAGSEPDEVPSIECRPAATGLALLAFLGAGYHHLDDKYEAVVRRGVEALIAMQHSDGGIYEDGQSSQYTKFYGHGIAALALCEAYGMTQDDELKHVAQQAIDFVAETQDTEVGGWRYAAQAGSDMSVSGWMIMSLKSAQLADLDVPADTMVRVGEWLSLAQVPNKPHLYVYNPYAPNTPQQRHGREPTPTMTSVGLLMRLYMHWRRTNPHVRAGADYLAAHPPQMGTSTSPQRDAYYWYYATQVMLHMHGDHWADWNAKLYPLVVDHQTTTGDLAGSWDPALPVADRWSGQAGRLYVTTLHLLTLEVYYRHLPIYDEISH